MRPVPFGVQALVTFALIVALGTIGASSHPPTTQHPTTKARGTAPASNAHISGTPTSLNTAAPIRPIVYVRRELVASQYFALLAAAVLLVSSLLARRLQTHRLYNQTEAANPLDIALWFFAFGLLLLDLILTRNGTLTPIVSFHVPSIDIDTVRAIVCALIIAAAGVHLSSLLDRYYVRPRMTGAQWQSRPCQHTAEPTRWKVVTQVWLFHRLASYLLVVAGLAGAILIATLHWVGASSVTQAAIAAIGATATILAGFYLTRAAAVIAFIQNPPVVVGDTIQLAEEYPTPVSAPEYFVVDVAVEGLKLVELGKPRSSGTHDRMLDVTDVTRLLRRRFPDKPCSDTQCAQVLVEYCPCVSRECPPTTRVRDENSGVAAAAGRLGGLILAAREMVHAIDQNRRVK